MHVRTRLVIVVGLILGSLGVRRADAVSCAGVPAWSGNGVAYAVGTNVLYNGARYTCAVAHTSVYNWDPIHYAQGWGWGTANYGAPCDGGATPTVTARPTVTPTTARATATVTSAPRATATGSGTCVGLPAFTSCTAYANGAAVAFAGHRYHAIGTISATRDCPPSSPYDPASDNWWVDDGACTGGAPTFTATATATRTPTPRGTARATATVTARPRVTATFTATRTPTATATAGSGGSPVAINGPLHVCGTRLCNQFGNAIQLRGMSTHGIQWYPQCVNGASMDALANDWQADVFRIAMYVQEGGYSTDPAGFKVRVDNMVSLAVARGLYVIIDWHILNPGDPTVNLTAAREFFTYMAQTHGNKANVIYEIANEPNGVSWATIKSYAEQVIPVIRQHDPDNIVLVGTRGWSSLGLAEGASSSEIVANPVSGTNLMYTFHFYAASHGANYRAELSAAADRIPVFASEWGTQSSSGDGANDFVSAQAYVDLMAQKKISWTNWNYSDDGLSGAVWTAGTCPNGPWTPSRLKPAGVWVRDRVLSPPDAF
jgi:aryl-phospho-beta-D-glucosidase BglC (GH1 family)